MIESDVILSYAPIDSFVSVFYIKIRQVNDKILFKTADNIPSEALAENCRNL